MPPGLLDYAHTLRHSTTPDLVNGVDIEYGMRRQFGMICDLEVATLLHFDQLKVGMRCSTG